MPNRNFFQDRDLFLRLLELELKRSLRYQSFTSVLLTEVPVNRRLGLKRPSPWFDKVVASLRSQIRETDIIGTPKENVIAVILLNCDKNSTIEVANRIISWWCHYFGFEIDSGTSNSGLGVGIACCPTDATDSEQLLSAAIEILEVSRRQRRSADLIIRDAYSS